MRLLLLLNIFALSVFYTGLLHAQCDTTDVLNERYDIGCILSSGSAVINVNPRNNYQGRFLNPEVSYDGMDFVFTPTHAGVFTLQYTDFDTCGTVLTRRLVVQDVQVGFQNYVPYDCTSLQSGSVDIVLGVGITVREIETGEWINRTSTNRPLTRYDENSYEVTVGQQTCRFKLPIVGPGPTTAVAELTYDCNVQGGRPTFNVTGNPTTVQYARYFQDDLGIRFQSSVVNIVAPAEVNGIYYYRDGCRTPFSGSIPNSPNPRVSAGNDFSLGCGRTSGFAVASPAFIEPPVVREWTTRDGVVLDHADSSHVTIGSPGTYVITLSNPISGCSHSDSSVVGQSQIFFQTFRDTFCSGVTTFQAGDTILTVPGFHQFPGTSGQCDTMLSYRFANRQPLAITVSTTAADGSMLGSAEVSANGAGSIASIVWSTGEMGSQITGLAPGTYSVTVTDNAGCSSTTDFDISFVSGNRSVIASTWEMYPNPSTGIVQLELDNNHPELEVQVYTLAGKLVFTTILGHQRNSLDLNQLAKGVYGVRLVDRQGVDYGVRLLTIE